MVSSVVAAGVLVVLFFTPWFASSLSTAWVREVLYVVLLLSGTLVVLPLLSTELLPTWCTHPVRAFLAFVDGLIDAFGFFLDFVRHDSHVVENRVDARHRGRHLTLEIGHERHDTAVRHVAGDLLRQLLARQQLLREHRVLRQYEHDATVQFHRIPDLTMCF